MLTLKRYAELRADVDAGMPLPDLLGREGLSREQWLDAQKLWLAALGAEVMRERFTLCRHYQDSYTTHRPELAGLSTSPALDDDDEEEDDMGMTRGDVDGGARAIMPFHFRQSGAHRKAEPIRVLADDDPLEGTADDAVGDTRTGDKLPLDKLDRGLPFGAKPQTPPPAPPKKPPPADPLESTADDPLRNTRSGETFPLDKLPLDGLPLDRGLPFSAKPERASQPFMPAAIPPARSSQPDSAERPALPFKMPPPSNPGSEPARAGVPFRPPPHVGGTGELPPPSARASQAFAALPFLAPPSNPGLPPPSERAPASQPLPGAPPFMSAPPPSERLQTARGMPPRRASQPALPFAPPPRDAASRPPQRTGLSEALPAATPFKRASVPTMQSMPAVAPQMLAETTMKSMTAVAPRRSEPTLQGMPAVAPRPADRGPALDRTMLVKNTEQTLDDDAPVDLSRTVTLQDIPDDLSASLAVFASFCAELAHGSPPRAQVLALHRQTEEGFRKLSMAWWERFHRDKSLLSRYHQLVAHHGRLLKEAGR